MIALLFGLLESSPDFWLFPHVLAFVQFGQTPLHSAVRDNVKATLLLLLHAHVGNLPQTHILCPSCCNHSFLSGDVFSNEADLEALLLVFITEIAFLQSRFVRNLHVHRVEHNTLSTKVRSKSYL